MSGSPNRPDALSLPDYVPPATTEFRQPRQPTLLKRQQAVVGKSGSDEEARLAAEIPESQPDWFEELLNEKNEDGDDDDEEGQDVVD